jgi:Domain of unknown function (DUF932)
MRQNLIFSRNSNNQELSSERIQQLAPAVFSSSKAQHLTERYVSLDTSDLIPVMLDYGYVPVQAAQKVSRVKTDDVLSHNSHLLSFAHRSVLGGTQEQSDVRPEITLYNSHDGSSSVQLYAGVFRFICSNGIVAGDGFSSRMYHSKSGLNGFEDMLKSTIESLPKMMSRIQALKQVQLDGHKQYSLALRGLETRWDLYDSAIQMKKGSYADTTTAKNALRVNRFGDSSSDAFTVLNRVQEAVMRGRTYVRSVTEDDQLGFLRKARAVNAVKESIRINSELWDIAEDVAFN